MKQNRDKILRDKIEGLTELPAGMQVSLESKWELLEAGLSEKKKRRFPLLSIAASILFITMTALTLWVSLSKNTVLQEGITKVPAKESLPDKEISEPEKIERSTIAEQKSMKPSSRAMKSDFPGAGPEFSQQPAPQNIPEPEMYVIIPVAEESPAKENILPMVAEVTLLSGKQPQKSKKRYIEMDFGTAQVETAENKAPPKQFSVKIPFLHKPDNPPGTILAAGEQSNPFRVQVSY